MLLTRLDRARHGASVLALSASLALTVTACGGSSAPPASSSSASPASSATSGSSGAAAAVSVGRRVFVSAGCGSCHTLAAVHATGRVGPNLDQLKPSVAAVVNQVTHGGGAMPSYAKRLSAPKIQAVAQFVASVTK